MARPLRVLEGDPGEEIDAQAEALTSFKCADSQRGFMNFRTLTLLLSLISLVAVAGCSDTGIGAGLGAGGGALVGSTVGHPVIGALVGGAGGAVVGHEVGEHRYRDDY